LGKGHNCDTLRYRVNADPIRPEAADQIFSCLFNELLIETAFTTRAEWVFRRARQCADRQRQSPRH
jgi:hypothetical protein